LKYYILTEIFVLCNTRRRKQTENPHNRGYLHDIQMHTHFSILGVRSTDDHSRGRYNQNTTEWTVELDSPIKPRSWKMRKTLACDVEETVKPGMCVGEPSHRYRQTCSATLLPSEIRCAL